MIEISPTTAEADEEATTAAIEPRSLRPRIESIDLLRGLIMIIMAIDHTRDFFTNTTVDPGSPVHSWPALFATRWITHLCAPGFVALAGTSIYLQRQRGKTVKQLRRFLVSRGLWLAFFDLVCFGYLISFSVPPMLTLGPLWVSGLSMIALACLLSFGTRMIGVIGATIILLHNLLDPLGASTFGRGAVLWNVLHEQTFLQTHGILIFIGYPLLPWIGVISIGYALGSLLSDSPVRRQRLAAILGAASLTLFCILRAFHGYGDHRVFTYGADAAHSAMSFLDLEKYPPSLQYLLATGGILLLLFALLDLGVTRGVLPRLRAVLDVYGRVPFFFFAFHFLLLHAAALLLTVAEHKNWHQWVMPGALFFHKIPGWGFGLPGIYCAWLCVLLLTYWPCLWFARVKARRRDWWLSYL